MTTATRWQRDGLARIMQSSAKYIIGVDEVGIGALAGPVYVVGAVYPKGWGDPDVRDSKKYSTKNSRYKAFVTKVLPNTIHHSIQTATSAEIDQYGVEPILTRLIRSAIVNCVAAAPDSVVVLDGLDRRDLRIAGHEVIAFPKADALVPAVSAASVIAKVTRDKVMEVLDERYPGYGFTRNSGYGTSFHLEALDQIGVSPIHRRSYEPIKRALAGCANP
jgi:ribonuclease HII